MKKTSYTDIATKELSDKLKEARTAVRTANFALAGVRTKSLKEAREAKKTVARIMTALTSRAKAGAK